MEKRKARLKPLVGGSCGDDSGALAGFIEALPPGPPSRSRSSTILTGIFIVLMAGCICVYAQHVNLIHFPTSGSPASTNTNQAKQISVVGAASVVASSKETLYSGPMTCQHVSKALLDEHALHNTVMITFTSKHMFELYGMTWLSNVRSAGISYWYLVVADADTATYVHQLGAHQCFLAEEMEITNMYADFKWGSKTWSLHTWQKVLTVRHVSQLGFNVVHSDLDIIWFRDPYPYFMEKYTNADYMVSLDPMTTKNPIGDDGPETGVTSHHYMNTGLYFLRATPGGRNLIDTWYRIRKERQEAGNHDQDGLYNYLRDQKEYINKTGRYTNIISNKTKLAQLPATQFQSGYSHCINKLHKVHGLQPYAVHMVWTWGENLGKVQRMREFLYFHDVPKYYEEPQFLSMDLTAIKTPVGFNDWRDILNDTERMLSHHLRSVEAQLTQLYYGFALALTLGRTLILPKIQCWCIQNWFENPLCRLPGELSTRFPLDCPSDYLFDMKVLMNLNVGGFYIDLREYSFLDNPRTPGSVKQNPVVVSLGEKSLKEASKAVLPKMPDLSLAAELEQYKGAKRLHFTNPALLFGGFTDPSTRKLFNEAMNKLPVVWCCRPDVVIKATGLPAKHPLRILPMLN